MIISLSGKMGVGKDLTGKILAILLNNPHLNNDGVLTFLRKEVGHSGNWQIKKFADKLKDIVCMFLNVDRETLENREFKEKELGEEWWYYKIPLVGGKFELVDYLENNKTNEWLNIANPRYLIKTTPRLLLQLLGTEAGRQIIHPNLWCNSLMSEYKPLVSTQGVIMNLGMSTSQLEKVGKEVPIEYPNWIITDTRFENELKAVKDRGGISIRVERPGLIENSHPSETSLDSATFDFIINNDKNIEHLINEVRKILEKENLI